MIVRIEHDSLGELEVPADAYYGVQTVRAIQNFPISGQRMPQAFIAAHTLLKKAAARVNEELGLLPKPLADAIAQACDEIIANAPWSLDQFPVDIYQTGSGTSTNMNVNEVIASRANELLNGKRGDKSPVHPNDHVNMGQSSNDTIPTSLQLMTLRLDRNELFPALQVLRESLSVKGKELWPVIKTGRTHLQDATPIRLGQEFVGYCGLIVEAIKRSSDLWVAMCHLPLGGTAVGTGINAHPEFAKRMCNLLTEWSRYEGMGGLSEAKNHFWPQATLDSAMTAHGYLRTLAVSLTKIANDIRWMGSGPRAGLGEIELPAVQPGSSIMPGKVNPVICESVLMVCQRVIGNDAAMTAAAMQNNFELAMSIPLAAFLLHESITLLANACRNFATQCIDGIKATARGPELVERGLMLATALVPAIGYEAAAAIAKEAAATGRTIREVARERARLSEERLKELLDPARMV
jgi:fumarate hydratase class II